MNTPYAILFPGQGSQSIGMLQDLASEFSIVEQTFAEASEILSYDMWQLVQAGPEEKLNLTEFTQAVMLTAGMSVYRVWQEKVKELPQYIIGHSLGEYTALVAAEALSFADALKLVQKRGQLMQSAVPEGQGAMAAIIGFSKAEVDDLCAQAKSVGYAASANYNSPQQTVIAGETNAVKHVIEQALSAGARMASLIPVSVPCHCQLLAEAAEQFKSSLNEVTFQKPKITVLSNVDVQAHGDAEQIREALYRQLFNPVRWVETIETLLANEIQTTVELGPGKVLSGLVKRMDRRVNTFPVNSPDTLARSLG